MFFSKIYLPDEFSFYTELIEEEKTVLQQYVTNSNENEKMLNKISIPNLAFAQVYALRGIIAYGIL